MKTEANAVTIPRLDFEDDSLDVEVFCGNKCVLKDVELKATIRVYLPVNGDAIYYHKDGGLNVISATMAHVKNLTLHEKVHSVLSGMILDHAGPKIQEDCKGWYFVGKTIPWTKATCRDKWKQYLRSSDGPIAAALKAVKKASDLWHNELDTSGWFKPSNASDPNKAITIENLMAVPGIFKKSISVLPSTYCENADGRLGGK